MAFGRKGKDYEVRKGGAITLAVFTVWPLFYMVTSACMISGMMASELSGGGDASRLHAVMAVIRRLHFFTMIDIVVLMAIYIVHVFRTDRVPRDKRALWVAVLFFGSIMSMPVYWYLYIWKGAKQRTTEKGAEGTRT